VDEGVVRGASPFPQSKGALVRDYGTAVAFVFLACLSASLLRSIDHRLSISLSFFFAAVALSAGYRGVGPGIAATLLSALIYDYFFLPPYGTLWVAGGDLGVLVLFVLVASLINLLSGRLWEGTRQADQRFQLVAREMAALNSITAAVSASLELPTALETLKRQLEQQLGAPGGCILLCEDEDRLRLAATWGAPEELCARVAALHPDELCGPPEPSPDGKAVGSPRLLSERELRSLGWREQRLTPLIANGKFEGVLCLFGDSNLSQAEDRRGFFEALGRQIGVLIQNARLFEQVSAAQKHLHHLSRQLVSVQEAERREIARELHDEIGQALTGLKLSLEMNARTLNGASGQPLRQALTLVNELMAHVQDLSLNLRPAMLDDLGLSPTLLWHFDRYTLSTGIRVHYEHSGIERRFPAEIETTAYRMIQEALTNVARHAGVSEATVRLWATPRSLCVQVTDFGRGFNRAAPARVGAGGLAGMEERITLLGGELAIESAPNAGTRLQAELPLPDVEAETGNDIVEIPYEPHNHRSGR
jgi:signal transduction histidine kinase